MISIDELSRNLEDNNVKWIQLHFTDLIGRLRSLHLPIDIFFKDVIPDGMGIDGSSVGFSKVEKSDMLVKPDLNSLLILPHEKDEARFLGEIYDTSNEIFQADPRYILRRSISYAKDMGFNEIKISPEMEFYILKEHDQELSKIVEQQGYFAPSSLDDCKNYRKKLTELLFSSGFPIKYHHHEVGLYQHEIEIKALDSLKAADYCIFFKYLAREVACLQNLLITFMPKPFSDDVGSGMHAHVCFYDNGKNMFMDESDEFGLSQTARYFIGGILEHARGMAAIANPTLNSYKRLIPNFEAPIYIAWAQYNRSSLVRIPARKNIDVEIRNPDPAANPYLLFSLIIHAGLDGIKKKLECEPIPKNIYEIGEEMKGAGIKKLPTNLYESLIELESDEVIKNAIGKKAVDMFIRYKKKEWQKYISETTDLEYKLYFHC